MKYTMVKRLSQKTYIRTQCTCIGKTRYKTEFSASYNSWRSLTKYLISLSLENSKSVWNVVSRIIQTVEACASRIPFLARFGRAGSYLNIRCRWQRVCASLAKFQLNRRAPEVTLRTCFAANFLIATRENGERSPNDRQKQGRWRGRGRSSRTRCTLSCFKFVVNLTRGSPSSPNLLSSYRNRMLVNFYDFWFARCVLSFLFTRPLGHLIINNEGGQSGTFISRAKI